MLIFMNTKKLFSWKYIVCLSLIISETFYFTLRIGATLIDDRDYSYIALNRYPVSDIIVSVAVAFVFSICLIYSFRLHLSGLETQLDISTPVQFDLIGKFTFDLIGKLVKISKFSYFMNFTLFSLENSPKFHLF